jgi:hypothetical protein
MGIVVYVSTELSGISLQLAGAIGAAGLSMAAGVPGMLAAVDQHAAEVRDALTASGRGLLGGRLRVDEADRALGSAGLRPEGHGPDWGVGSAGGRGPGVRVLLGYARGFVEAAMGRGWLPVPGPTTDWESLRLAAVCQLLTQSQPAPLA